MSEEKYIKPEYCLECSSKHANRLEHHYEDIVTATKDNPRLREQAQNILDDVREIRKKTDEIRIEELAKNRLQRNIG
jgi:hypothetical protein